MRFVDRYPIIVTPKLADCRDFWLRLKFTVVFEASWFVLLQAEDGSATLAFMHPDHPSTPPGPETFSGKGMCLELRGRGRERRLRRGDERRPSRELRPHRGAIRAVALRLPRSVGPVGGCRRTDRIRRGVLGSLHGHGRRLTHRRSTARLLTSRPGRWARPTRTGCRTGEAGRASAARWRGCPEPSDPGFRGCRRARRRSARASRACRSLVPPARSHTGAGSRWRSSTDPPADHFAPADPDAADRGPRRRARPC